MNPTPSQPERPEPPEGYRLLTDEEKKLPLPMDAICFHENDNRWFDSYYKGERAPRPSLVYATAIATRTAPEAEQFQKGGDESCRTIPDATTPVSSTDGVAEGHPVPNVRSDAPAAVLSGSQGQAPEAVAGEPEVLLVQMQVCRACLDGVGQECHTAGCAMWLHKVDLPFDPNIYQVIPTPPVEADKDAETLREEVEAFVKHTGAPNFKEAVDVLIRTNAGHMEQVEQQFNKIKEQGKDLTTARATIAERDAEIARLKKFQDDMESTGAIKLPELVPISYAELVAKLAERNKRIETLVRALAPFANHFESLEAIGSGTLVKVEFPISVYIGAKAALAHAAEGKEQA